MWSSVTPIANAIFQHMFETYWIMCSKYANHSMLNSHHSLGWGRDLYIHLISTRIFTLKFNKIFIRAPKIMRNVAMGLFWTC